MADYDASSIEVLSGIEAIRRRPGMYVGPLANPALPVRLLLQSLCHAVDCGIDGTCRRIAVTVAGVDVNVTYDTGLPLEVDLRAGDVVAKLFLTSLCGCKNRKKHIQVGDELCDLGLTTLTALTESLRVETRSQLKTATYQFARGQEVGRSDVTYTTRDDATIMDFRLDPSILSENVVFNLEQLGLELQRVRQRIPHVDVSWAR